MSVNDHVYKNAAKKVSRVGKPSANKNENEPWRLFHNIWKQMRLDVGTKAKAEGVANILKKMHKEVSGFSALPSGLQMDIATWAFDDEMRVVEGRRKAISHSLNELQRRINVVLGEDESKNQHLEFTGN